MLYEHKTSKDCRVNESKHQGQSQCQHQVTIPGNQLLGLLYCLNLALSKAKSCSGTLCEMLHRSLSCDTLLVKGVWPKQNDCWSHAVHQAQYLLQDLCFSPRALFEVSKGLEQQRCPDMQVQCDIGMHSDPMLCLLCGVGIQQGAQHI